MQTLSASDARANLYRLMDQTAEASAKRCFKACDKWTES